MTGPIASSIGREAARFATVAIPREAASDGRDRQAADDECARPRHPIRNGVLIGLAAGAGAGLAWGRASDCRGCDDPGLTTVIGPVFGAPIGAGIGLLVGILRAQSDPTCVADAMRR